ncbi:MAG: hypothetical protein HRT90_04235, partial [Candidatus Margulisbacteria bacterium]|nr:hypothetical protein [Candidatus Margulisiibacteriota bacterium]
MMTFNERLKALCFSKKSSLRSKILFPFVLITLFMTVSSVIIAIYFINQSKMGWVIEDLEKHHQHFVHALKNRDNQTLSYSRFVQDMTQSPVTKKLKRKRKSTRLSDVSVQVSFDEVIQKIEIHDRILLTNRRQLSIEKRDRYSLLLKKNDTGESDTGIYMFKTKSGALKMVLASMYSSGKGQEKGVNYL